MDYEDIDVMTQIEKLESEIHDMQLELNRAQSELKRSKEISKRQGEITAINMEDFIELTDELREVNAAIREFVAQRGRLLCHEDGMITELYEKAIDRALKES